MASCNFRACDECTQRCFSLHKDHGNIGSSSPVVPSFFKFIHGTSCLTKLLIPPNFAQTIMTLVDQKVELEDSKGHCWEIEVSSDKKFIFFHQGWHQFALDHSLETGEFLVFNHLMTSHFEVKIFGRSGSEKLKFSNRESEDAALHGNVRNICSTPDMLFDNVMVDGERSTPAKATPSMTERGWTKEQGSYNTSAHSDSSVDIVENECVVPIMEKLPITIEKANLFDKMDATPQTVHNDFTEVPFYMIERDSENFQEANRSCLFDLSDYEMVNCGSAVGRNDKVAATKENRKLPHSVAKTTQPETESQVGCFQDEGRVSRKDSMDTGRKRKRTPSDFIGNDPGGHSFRAETIQPPIDKTSTSNSASSEFKRRIDSMKKVPLFEEKYFIGSTTPRDPQSTSSTEYPQKSTGHQEKVNEGSRKHLPKKQKSAISGMDLLSQAKPKAYTGKSGAVPVIAKELPGNVKDPILKKTNHLSGSKLGAVKAEPQDMSYPSMKLQGQATKVVKTENMECYGDSPLNSEPSSSSAPLVTRSYLEFPTNTRTLFSGGKMRMERKVVILRDPAGRVWPVLYQETSGLRVLVSGWKSLANMNNIQDGDQCLFESENEGENLYRKFYMNRKLESQIPQSFQEDKQDEEGRSSTWHGSIESQPMAGLYTKVTRKPTNHSKFTGKCGTPRCDGCHTHPVCKSKSKAKGTQKLKSVDVAKNHKLTNWRVVDEGDDDYLDDEEVEEDYAGDVNRDLPVLTSVVMEENNENLPVLTGIVIEDNNGEVEIYDVGFVLEQVVEDEDWCLVEDV